MTQIVSNSAVKQQIAITLLMAPSQPSHFLEKQCRSRAIHHKSRSLLRCSLPESNATVETHCSNPSQENT
ncbi:hypothetical protein E2C01_074518 [Portunus trituberculatus]|uniref:Uncharacterized protein n=1 Tax=Portunus trituberculatus TaxID=210409 RepID=A0A5B7IGG8_PORTR|nr:hypothetical protein [Portunus trituberculatus]